jgi:hypothetical protein
MIQDFHDLLSELLRSDVAFLVVGAHALGVHGIPRATADLDVWIRPDPENAARVYEALLRFGVPLEELGVKVQDLTEPDMVAQFGLPPYRLDILTSISGVTFEAAWNDRAHGIVEGVQVPVLGLAAFIQNKRVSGRTKDLADLESLGANRE